MLPKSFIFDFCRFPRSKNENEQKTSKNEVESSKNLGNQQVAKEARPCRRWHGSAYHHGTQGQQLSPKSVNKNPPNREARSFS